MNIIHQSLDIALSILPKAKEQRNTKNKFFHFAFGYRKNKLIAIGQNNPEKTHTQALVFAKRFKTDDSYPYLHAETDLLSRLWGKYYIDSSLSMVIVRLNKHGVLRNSQPCPKCAKILHSLDINKVYWSTNDGFNT
jgi:tRNA(Arg) A34 adenosine deaminase TadA